MNFSRVAITFCVSVLLIATGCNGRSYQVSSPVLGPVPPRVSSAEVAERGSQKKSSNGKAVRGQNAGIERVSYDEKQPLRMTEVIAEVNGEPILAHEILDRYAPQMNKQKLKPEQMRKAQLELIKKNLPNVIDQTLMVDSIKTNMKPEQLKAVEAQMDKYFEGEIQKLMKTTNAGSPTELEAILQANGTSLVTLRKNFGDRQLAGQYMRTKMGTEPTASREEMRIQYEQDIATFTESEEVKWQQIDIDYKAHGGVEGAEAAAQELLAQIRSGEITFDAAAHGKSDSPLASSGGHSDWTNPESLADADMKAALKSLEVDGISEVIPTKTACVILMVTGRHEARVIPFNEVQKELHDRVINERKKVTGDEVMKALKATAIIHTILDDEEVEDSKEVRSPFRDTE